MADSYPIVQVHPEWVLEREDMGTKEKFAIDLVCHNRNQLMELRK